ARLVAFRRDFQYLGVGVLGLGVLGEFERGVRNDNPGGTPDRPIRGRIFIDDALVGLDGGLLVLHLVQVIGRRSENRRSVLVLRECVGKLERAHDRIALDGALLLL